MNRAWSDDEIHLLKKIYSNSTVTGLMRNINRTYTAIYKKAYNLKLKRNQKINIDIKVIVGYNSRSKKLRVLKGNGNDKQKNI